jgi:phosphoribosylformylglycinamidine synthase subunit PurQ / glutaminase
VSAARVGVIVFPGTNSEDETKRACEAAGLATDLVHWKTPLDDVRRYDALVLPGGFAYEDRVRAGVIAAHDHVVEAVRESAARGKPVLGICNGAQVLIESGLVPGIGETVRPQAGFARNARGGRYVCRHVYVRLNVAPQRCIFAAHMTDGAVLPAWASHGEGRLAASQDVLDRIVAGGHDAFVYCDADGTRSEAAVPNGSALGVAGLTNAAGNVLALMPHPERDAWTFMHGDGAQREAARGDAARMLAASGGIALFAGLAAALA